MNFNSLSKATKITRISAGAVDGQGDVTSSILDMSGWEGVIFIAELGDVDDTCVLTLTCEQGDALLMGDAAALTGTTTFTADATSGDDKVMTLEEIYPTERYVRAVLGRATANAIVDSILAIQFGAATKPTTHDATTVVASESYISAAEA